MLRVELQPRLMRAHPGLSAYVRQTLKEKIDGYRCGACSRSGQVVRKHTVIDAPEYLLVSLKRFNPDGSKNTSRVHYGEHFNLSSHLEDGAQAPLKYQLMATINHGDQARKIEFGHYITVLKGPSGTWHMINDQSVRRAKATDATNIRFPDLGYNFTPMKQLTLLALWVALVGLASPVLSETVLGLVIFTRHGDRTAKFFQGYHMTNLGASQLYASGADFRRQYIEDGSPHQILNIAPDAYRSSEIWSGAPDQSILLQTATNFLQGLYPPLAELGRDVAVETLVNGSDIVAPLGGYQYIPVHGASEREPDTIWIKGDEECPAYTAASKSYDSSAEYLSTLESSREFYSQFVPLLENIMPAADVTYAHAFDIFDLLNVASIHNASIASAVSASQLARLRFYADQSEWAHNQNVTQPERSIGGRTLAGAILRQLRQTVSSQGQLKVSLFAGSYDTFLAFFASTNLTAADPNFSGLPSYASSMSFELFVEQNLTTFPQEVEDLRVRFLFRNGTVDSTSRVAYPLFGRAETSLPYERFVEELGSRAINNVGEWCATCRATVPFCSQGNGDPLSGPSSANVGNTGRGSKLTAVHGGVIGAVVMLAVLALGATGFTLARRVKRTRSASRLPSEKTDSNSDADRDLSR
ncbi:MAG: hypothetical protein M1817_004486 [Caeruleum heppii]|nr:MAG: hypothetical protein M1817_004486 [Caeruleum heppii]